MVDISIHCTLSTGMYIVPINVLNPTLAISLTCTHFLSSMEALLEQHKNHPTVKLIYFPTEVNRTESLLQGTKKNI